MAYAVARQEKYIKTKKGKLAHARSAAKYRKKQRDKKGGRLERRLIRIKSERGEDVARWYKKQKAVCQICFKVVRKAPPRSATKQNQAVIDHDHKTGKIRGLLCHQCNLGLGNFKDKIDVLRQAIMYICKANGNDI